MLIITFIYVIQIVIKDASAPLRLNNMLELLIFKSKNLVHREHQKLKSFLFISGNSSPIRIRLLKEICKLLKIGKLKDFLKLHLFYM